MDVVLPSVALIGVCDSQGVTQMNRRCWKTWKFASMSGFSSLVSCAWQLYEDSTVREEVKSKELRSSFDPLCQCDDR